MMSKAVIEKVTGKILESIRNDKKLPWQKPWAIKNCGLPRNGITQKEYNGFNLLTTVLSGYSNPNWFTFNQVRAIKGATVKKNEHGTPIVYCRKTEKSESVEARKKDPSLKPEYFFMTLYYTVFNAEQIDGLDMGKYGVAPVDPKDNKAIVSCQNVIQAYKGMPEIKERSLAAYDPLMDVIYMPDIKSFIDSESYYATLFHEMAHSTGHKDRLNRKNKNMFASTEYSFEELIAEMTSFFLCGHTGIANERLEMNTEAYLLSWVKHLEDQPSALITASQIAGKAYKYIIGENDGGKEDEEEI